MSVSILAPRSGDTVTSPVIVSTAYDFGASNCTITSAMGTALSTSPSHNNQGIDSATLDVPVTTPTVFSVNVTTTPTSGGSDSQGNVTVTTSNAPPPVVVGTIITVPPPPPPGPHPHKPSVAAATTTSNKKHYNVTGKTKNTTITSVSCQVMQVNMTTTPPSWSNIGAAIPATLSGITWHANDIVIDRAAGCQYTIQATAFVGTTKAGQFTKAVPA